MLLEQVGILRLLKQAGGLLDRVPNGVSLGDQLDGMLTNSESAYELLDKAYMISSDEGLRPLLKRLNYVIGHMDSAIDRKDYDEYLVDEFSAYLETLGRSIESFTSERRG